MTVEVPATHRKENTQHQKEDHKHPCLGNVGSDKEFSIPLEPSQCTCSLIVTGDIYGALSGVNSSSVSIHLSLVTTL